MITKDEFIRRAQRRYLERWAAQSTDEAFYLAEALWNDGEAAKDVNSSNTPEDIVDEDVENVIHWDPDE